MVTAKPQECMRVPSMWRTVGGLKEYTIEVGGKIGALMDKRSRLEYAIGRRSLDVEAEWVPEIGRAADVVEEWKRLGFEKQHWMPDGRVGRRL